MKLLESRYLKRDVQGKIIESAEGMFRRVAHEVAAAEKRYADEQKALVYEKAFYQMMIDLDFLPNSPTLMNAGTTLGQLSACFVLALKDSMKDIFESIKNAALIQQSGGGTGFNFSALRPEGDPVKKTGGVASGPVSFMKIMNAATEYIKQGGKRRGANMGILNIDHPDIMTFIKAKRKGKALQNFNLSVAISDSFMECLMKEGQWPLIHPNSKKVHSLVKAKDLWDEIVYSAWRCGDPGLLFMDEINRHNPTPEIGRIEACNPCGEVPLLAWESCNLGSLNLLNMLKDGSDPIQLDHEKLKKTIHLAIRFLDNVIDVNNYIIKECKAISLANRKIGLGVMGWADLLLRLKIPYNSKKALKLGADLMHFIQDESIAASRLLAKERGVFPNWKHSIYYPDLPLRNATRTSIAPTGSISILANCSSSIEPLFALLYERRHILEDDRFVELHPLFRNYLEKDQKMSPQEIENLDAQNARLLVHNMPASLRKYLVTSHEISWEYHLKHQIAFQQYTDNAVSKTINLPEDAGRGELAKAYMQAWRSGAKGITIYRYNSLQKQVLSLEKKAGSIPLLIRDGASNCKVCSR